MNSQLRRLPLCALAVSAWLLCAVAQAAPEAASEEARLFAPKPGDSLRAAVTITKTKDGVLNQTRKMRVKWDVGARDDKGVFEISATIENDEITSAPVVTGPRPPSVVGGCFVFKFDSRIGIISASSAPGTTLDPRNTSAFSNLLRCFPFPPVKAEGLGEEAKWRVKTSFAYPDQPGSSLASNAELWTTGVMLVKGKAIPGIHAEEAFEISGLSIQHRGDEAGTRDEILHYETKRIANFVIDLDSGRVLKKTCDEAGHPEEQTTTVQAPGKPPVVTKTMKNSLPIHVVATYEYLN